MLIKLDEGNWVEGSAVVRVRAVASFVYIDTINGTQSILVGDFGLQAKEVANRLAAEINEATSAAG